jgi:uncharacterized protein (TIGR02597 family)
MKKLFSLLLAGLISSPCAFSAVVAYSPPVGGMTVTLTGAVVGGQKITAFTPALRLPVGPTFTGKSRGSLTNVSATQFTDTSASWSAGALSQASAPYFVKLTSGAAAGTWWQVSTTAANTVSTLTILNRGVSPLTLGVVVGDKYEIVPADTLATLFSDLEPSIGGANATTADTVRIHDGTSWREYYYNTSAGGWREGASGFNRSNTVVRPDSGIFFVRKTTGNLGLRMLGQVATVRERIVVNPTGLVVIGSVFPVARTVGSLNIQAVPGFVAFAGDQAACDKISFYDGTSWRVLQYNPTASQWREGASAFNRNTLPIPLGSPIILQRGSAATGSAALLDLNPPYTL